MSVDALIQTYLLDKSDNATETFLTRFDKDWTRYNRDTIQKLSEYEKEQNK
jgi:raffinose/stachyose/melibiose transport system substrate-binding protein